MKMHILRIWNLWSELLMYMKFDVWMASMKGVRR